MKTFLLLGALALPCLAPSVATPGEGGQDDPPRVDPKTLKDERPTHRLWEKMDYGPFLTAAVSMPWPAGAVTQKGIVLKVGKGSVCFDTDLLRYAGGWSDGWLELLGPPFEGSRKPDAATRPVPKGVLRFATRNIPGWARGDDFSDPRAEHLGPLPSEQAKYRGLYIHGARVVFSYTVGACEVLDLPGEEQGAISRTLRLGPSAAALTMLVAETPESREVREFPGGLEMGDLVVGGVGLPPKAEWLVQDRSRVALRVPAHDRTLLFKVVIGSDISSVRSLVQANSVENPETLTKDAPTRYPEPVVTRGVLGKTGGAFEVDTLTLPDQNPWSSWMRLGGLDFFSDGRAAICTWSGDVWVVSGIDAGLEKVSWRRVASGLFQPCGLRIVDDVIYVAARDQITRLRDLNGDGEADFYENFNNDIAEKGNYHEFVMDLQTDAEGNFYFSKGGLGANFPAGPAARHHGCLIKLSKDGKTFEIVATGIRAGAGLGIGPRGELTISDNDGHWGPASRINWIQKGGYYGDPYTAHRTPVPKDFDPPLCWIHRGVDPSCGGQVWVPDGAWGPLGGHLLNLSYGNYALFHVLYERVGDRMQGGVVRFPLTFASGSLRGRFHPKDGHLYVAGIKGWSSGAARDGCLQRVRYTGKPVRMVSELHVRHDAIELAFTDPVDPETAGDPDSYSAQQWNYLYSENYGSPDFSVANPKKQGRDPVEIKSAKVSSDGKKVTLEIPGLQPVMQMSIKLRLRAADGGTISQEITHTIHRVPR
jgi:glucose/arabinose dehydrogenase